MKDLRDKVVVITGAGSGIGRATALQFAREGARLELVDIDGAAVEAVRNEIEALGAGAASHEVDCADAEAVQQLADDIFARRGRVDVLHNNAGVCCGGPVEEISLDDWRWITDNNYWGVVNGIRAFVPGMIEQGGGGHILNTASMAGLVPLPMVAPYCATKSAVVGLSEALDIELAIHGIRVSAVCPGATRTRVLENAHIDLPGAMADKLRSALARWAPRPEKTARKIVATVKRGRGLRLIPGELAPLWVLHRLSPWLYQVLWRAAAKRAIGGLM